MSVGKARKQKILLEKRAAGNNGERRRGSGRERPKRGMQKEGGLT